LKLKSGKSVSGFRDCPRGDPEAPEYIESPGQFETEIETKFRTLLKSTAFASWMDPMVEAVKALPTADNVKPLTALIGAPPV
jgi:hypothetical protein